jgi:hypothetical protein
MTTLQKLAIAIAAFSFVGGASAQLTPIFAPLGPEGPIIVSIIVSLCGFVGGILGVIVGVMTGQGAQVTATTDMLGVEKLEVNKNANPTLAALAVDLNQEKISIKPGDEAAVQQTAKGT